MKLLNITSSAMLAIIVASTTVATPAAADRSYMGGGAGQFEDVVRGHGSQVGQGARNYGSRAVDAARSRIVRNGVAVGRGISAMNQTRTILGRGGPLPLVIVPKGYAPGTPWKR